MVPGGKKTDSISWSEETKAQPTRQEPVELRDEFPYMSQGQAGCGRGDNKL